MALQEYVGLPIDRYITVGSYPLYYQSHGDDARFVVKDIDVICWEKDIKTPVTRKDDYQASFTDPKTGLRVECLLADKHESLQALLKEYKTTNWEVLYIMLAGHINYPSKKFDQYIQRYSTCKARIKITPKIEQLVALHKKSTKERKGVNKSPKLVGVTKEKFFDDKVVKFVPHDDIHQMMAYKELPMYRYMQKDPNLVECSKELWDQFPIRDKIMAVLEECYVIALERHIIPQIFTGEPGMGSQTALFWALKRVCTTLCSGWFRDFATNNYIDITSNFDYGYVDGFLKEYKIYEKNKEDEKYKYPTPAVMY